MHFKICRWQWNPIFLPRIEFVSSPRELHDRKGKPDPLLITGKRLEAKSQLPQVPLQCIPQRRASSRMDPDCSQTLVTVVSPDLPVCHVCLPRRVAWGSLHHACCPWRIFFLSCVVCDILFENLLTFRITGFLLTLLLVLVEWEFSWKDEALFTLVIEWLWRRKGMGQKQGTSNCCHTHADKTTSL